MRKLLPAFVVFLLFSVPAFATVSFVGTPSSGTTSNLTLTTTPTAGNLVEVIVQSSAVPASVQFTTGSTQNIPMQGQCPQGPASIYECLFIQPSVTGGGTHVTCTTCGTINAIWEYEINGADSTTPLDRRILCPNTDTATVCTVNYHPAFSSEALTTSWLCNVGASTVTGSGVTWGSVSAPNSNPGADAISSGNGLVTSVVGAGCDTNLGMIVGIKAAGATETCETDLSWNADEAELGTSGSPLTTIFVNWPGDLVITTPWCRTNGSTTCTVTSPTVGSDALTDIGIDGSNSTNTGQGHIYYDLSASAGGSQTVTFVPSGTRLNSQIAAWDFTPSPGCAVTHHTDYGPGSGTSTTVNLPSFSPTATDLLFTFGFVNNHVSAINSPWACSAFYMGTGTPTSDCTLQNTVNAGEYIENASSGTINADFTQAAADDWQTLVAAFSIALPGGQHGIAVIY